MSFVAYWQENFRRTIREWEGWQAILGIAVVLATAAGYGYFSDDPKITQWSALAAGVYLAVMLLVVTPQRMWDRSRQEVAELRGRLEPSLHLVFEPDTVPYLQEQILRASDNKTVYVDRRFRVGIRNDSSQVIRDVRVVLESFEQLFDGQLLPTEPTHPVLLEHALNIMGRDDKNGLVDVAPGDRPTAFADVIVQAMNSDRTEGDYMSPCYASGHFTNIFSRSTFVLGLRVEGGGTYSRARFRAGATLKDRPIYMISLS